MSVSIMLGASCYDVIAIDVPGLWWESVSAARRILAVDDRSVAHGVARYLESVEWAVHVLAVNGADHFGRLHGVASGELPIEALEIASEMVAPNVDQYLVVGETHPPRIGSLHRAHGMASLPESLRSELPGHVRRMVGEGLRQAYDPGSRLAALRAAGELVIKRSGHRLSAPGEAVRLRPDIARTLLECERCLCEFWIVPDASQGFGVERYGAPKTVEVEWKSLGVDLSVALDELDECPCHGGDVVLPWGSSDAHLLASVADLLGRPRGAVSAARLATGPALVVDLVERRVFSVSRAASGEWQYSLSDASSTGIDQSVGESAPLLHSLDGTRENTVEAIELADSVRAILRQIAT